MSAFLRELDLREYGDWPLLHRAIVCVLLAVLAFALPWWGLTRSAQAEQRALVIVERDVQARLAHARQQVDGLPPLPSSETEELAAPQPPDLSALITAIAESAQASGLHSGQFKPLSPPATDAPVEGLPIELRLHGGWPQLSRFAAALAAPTWDASMHLREIRLRAQTAAPVPMLELSATVWVSPRSVTDVTPVSERLVSAISLRNPFMEGDARMHPATSHSLAGSLRSGRDHVGLVLTADGELRRVRSSSQ